MKKLMIAAVALMIAVPSVSHAANLFSPQRTQVFRAYGKDPAKARILNRELRRITLAERRAETMKNQVAEPRAKEFAGLMSR